MKLLERKILWIGLAAWIAVAALSPPLHAASVSLIASEIANPFTATGVDIQSDNRLRSFQSGGQHIDGWLRFDVSSIPDTASINAMTLTLYGEGAFDVPVGQPGIQVRRSSLDSWTNGGSGFPSSYDEALTPVDTGPFPATRHDPYAFSLNVGAVNWSGDLVDNQLSLVLVQNQISGIHRMYFFGPAGVTATGDANSRGSVFDFAPRLDVEFQTAAVPIPASLPLFLTAVAGMGVLAGRRRRAR